MALTLLCLVLGGENDKVKRRSHVLVYQRFLSQSILGERELYIQKEKEIKAI